MTEKSVFNYRNIACVPDKELVAVDFPEKQWPDVFEHIFSQDWSFEIAGYGIIIFPPEVAEEVKKVEELKGAVVPIVSLEKLPPGKLRQLRRQTLV